MTARDSTAHKLPKTSRAILLHLQKRLRDPLYSQREAPVPSGVTSLDLALDVKEAGSGWEGRIVSSETLHYPGDPQIKIGFSEAPGTSTMSALTSLSAVVDLGGRYHVDSSAACDNATDFQKSTYPWFIPGFTEEHPHAQEVSSANVRSVGHKRPPRRSPAVQVLNKKP
ncbi:MAG: hypothetical protein H6728_01545 [Myxococcales bacterium]|nr:hypothetical protein [Myxococcales bacterium]